MSFFFFFFLLLHQLGINENEFVSVQTNARDAQLAIERERASHREIAAAPEKVRERLGHDPHKEKLKRVLALDDAEIDSLLHSRHEDFVQRQSAAPACAPQARVAAAAPSKAQRVVGFEPRQVSLAKVAELLDLDQSAVADAQSELVVATATPRRRDVWDAPEKAQRVVGVAADSDDKVKERLGLSEEEWRSVKQGNRASSAPARGADWRATSPLILFIFVSLVVAVIVGGLMTVVRE